MRIYTHAIIARTNYEHALAAASILKDIDLQNFDYYAEVSAAGLGHRNGPTQADLEKYSAIVAAYDRDTYAEYKRLVNIDRVQELKLAGVYETFSALTWCGRPDLAVKELAKYRANPYFADAHAVDAVPLQKKGR